MIKYSAFLVKLGYPDSVVSVWKSIANAELLIASAVITYIFVNMKVFVFKSIKQVN